MRFPSNLLLKSDYRSIQSHLREIRNVRAPDDGDDRSSEMKFFFFASSSLLWFFRELESENGKLLFPLIYDFSQESSLKSFYGNFCIISRQEQGGKVEDLRLVWLLYQSSDLSEDDDKTMIVVAGKRGGEEKDFFFGRKRLRLWWNEEVAWEEWNVVFHFSSFPSSFFLPFLPSFALRPSRIFTVHIYANVRETNDFLTLQRATICVKSFSFRVLSAFFFPIYLQSPSSFHSRLKIDLRNGKVLTVSLINEKWAQLLQPL